MDEFDKIASPRRISVENPWGWSRLALSTMLFGLHVGCQSTGDQFLSAGGLRIRYQVAGRGEPVVLLHAFGETLESWHRAGVVRLLSRHFRVIAMDVRGHGRSGKPHAAGAYGRDLARDVVRLLDLEGAAQAHIVGYSMGGLIALDVAAFHSDRVLSVVLGGAGWPGPESLGDFREQAAAFEQGRIPMREGEDGRALAALLRGLAVPSEAEMRQIKGRMLVLIGAEDRFLSDVERLSRVIPGTKVVIIPDANHGTTMTHPKFGAELVGWLLAQSGRERARAESS